MGTKIRTFVGMYTVMSLKIRLAVKALPLHSQPLFSLQAAAGQHSDCNCTFGQSSHEHSNGRADCMPAEASRSETVAFAIEALADRMVVRDRAISRQRF